MIATSELWAAVRWWGALLLLGTAVTPLAYRLLPALADRGYAFSKMLGLLLVSYAFWLLGSLGFLANDLGGILVALLIVLGLSGWAVRGHFTLFRQWLQANWQQILLTELLFLAIFALWVWARAQNPVISGTEKPMEFAFLNAVGRSATFPPVDPWLSGFAISYYYFGYVMTSVLARLAFVPEAIAFNLGIAWLVAGTAVGAFGVVYNLIAAQAGPNLRGYGRLLAVVAALALPLAGNGNILFELLHSSGSGSDEMWRWLDIRDINGPAQEREELRFWWWWRSSRVINEYSLAGAPTDPEPIAEFPGFSFVLGDMHPHVLALPFAFLSIAVAYQWFAGVRRIKKPDESEEEDVPPPFWHAGQQLLTAIGLPLYGLTVILLGGLSFLNTWDVLIHLFIFLGAFTLNQWRHEGWSWGLIGRAALVAGGLVIPAFLLYLPFYLGFSSQAGPPYLLPTLVRPTRLVQFLIMFGLPLIPLTTLIVALLARQRLRHLRKGLLVAGGLLLSLLLLALLLGWIIAASAAGAGRLIGLANELGLALPPRPEAEIAAGWGVTAVLTILPALLQVKLAFPGVVLLLSLLIGGVVMVWNEMLGNGEDSPVVNGSERRHDPLPFVLLLLLTGALLTLGPEFVYLRDNFGVRINTVFKFYYQAWVFFGVSALFALFYLWQRFRRGLGAVLPVGATAVYAFLFAVGLLFPYYGVTSRAAEFRGRTDAPERGAPTLNGLAHLERFNPDEYEAIMWLRENVAGTPTILEAVGGQYSNFGRISAGTGLPTVLGWAGHQYQWRGSDTPEPGVRDPAVREIYEAPRWEGSAAADWLDQYDVAYIYVGQQERTAYGANGRIPGQEKFNEQLPVAFQNNSVIIYRWQAQ
jgi:YYY domain-containing protein